MVNKYGNDFLNNIMWNKEYPFIPEVTNDNGFTIHEQDIVDFYSRGPVDGDGIRLYAGRVYKIYDKDHIWIRYYAYKKHIFDFDVIANELLPHTSCEPFPPSEVDSFNTPPKGMMNVNRLEIYLSSVYNDLYSDELSLENDWHFDENKYENKRLMEVAKLKEKLKYKC